MNDEEVIFSITDKNAWFKHNGAVLIECKTIRRVVSSAAEAETHGVFHNAKIGVNIRHILNAMGHRQPPTLLITANSPTAGLSPILYS